MEKVILEILKDSGHRADYKVFSSLIIRIGRGYDNDLILSDLHVSEGHCIIHVHEEGYSLEDLSSINGTWIISASQERNYQRHKNIQEKSSITSKVRKEIGRANKIKVEQSLPIYSGDMILIGDSRLRFIVSGHEVEPARLIDKPNAFFEEISSPWKAFLIIISAFFLSCAVEHQESYKNLPLSKFISFGIGLLLVITVWSGIWSFVGWLVKRRAHFNAHLSWATLFFLGMTITFPLADHLGYLTSSQNVELAVGSLIFWIFIALLIAGHLVIATFIARFYQIIVAVGLSMVIVVFGVVTYYAGKADFNSQPEMYATLVPPYGRIFPGDSIDQFLKKSDKVFLIQKDDR